jgi:hypothetical protein
VPAVFNGPAPARVRCDPHVDAFLTRITIKRDYSRAHFGLPRTPVPKEKGWEAVVPNKNLDPTVGNKLQQFATLCNSAGLENSPKPGSGT